MSVYKDKERGTWYIMMLYKDAHGKRKQKCIRGFRTKKEALEKERELKASFNADADVPLVSFVETYFNDKRNELKERSIINKRYMLTKHVLPYFADKKLNEIKSTDIINWQNLLQEMGYSEAYLRMLANQLTALLNHAVRYYGLKSNPYSAVKKMGKSDGKRVDFWTVDEYYQFRSEIPKGSQYYVLFEILFWTGCREGELLALTPADFDFRNKTMRINKTYYRHNGVDMITEPKTETSERTIHIPDFLCEEVKEYIKKLYELPENERLFPIVAEAVQHKMKRVCEKTGVKKMPVHCIRHSHASYLISQGVQPILIKERLGHKDISVTLNTYSHLYPNMGKSIADMMDTEVNKKQSPVDGDQLDS